MRFRQREVLNFRNAAIELTKKKSGGRKWAVGGAEVGGGDNSSGSCKCEAGRKMICRLAEQYSQTSVNRTGIMRIVKKNVIFEVIM